MKGDGHLYIVYDANGKALARPYRMRGMAKEKARKIGGSVEVILDGVKRKEKEKEEKETEAQGNLEGETEL